jgi:hypothetical protein
MIRGVFDVLVRLAYFVVVGSAAFIAMSAVFGLYCFVGGHNLTEALYGGFATYVLSVVAGIESAWLLDQC